jgi:trehalose 6-phosphate synthase/phosphatase
MVDLLKPSSWATWARDFIQQLQQARQAVEGLHTEPLSDLVTEQLLDAYRSSSHRLIFLDYDGTLAPFRVDPAAANPTQHVLELLEKLSQDPATDVVIVSGRDRATLGEWLGPLEIGLVAEHGVWIKESTGQWQTPHMPPNEWMGDVRPILDLYSGRLPGSFVEEKSFSLALHYRGADPELAAARVRELVDRLTSLGANESLHILPGNMVLEVRTDGVDKGTAARRWLPPAPIAEVQARKDEPGEPDASERERAKGARADKDDKGNADRGQHLPGTHFVLAVGDDFTDEDLFLALSDVDPTWSVWPVKVGSEAIASAAQYRLSSHQDVLRLLELLALSGNRSATPAQVRGR